MPKNQENNESNPEKHTNQWELLVITQSNKFPKTTLKL